MIRKKIKIEGYEVFPDSTVKLSALMKHMQQAACDDIDQFGLTYEALRQDDMVFVIIKMGISFNREIRKGDEIEILTVNNSVEGIVFIREFILYKDGLPVAEATTHWVLMSYERRLPVRPARLRHPMPEVNMDINGVYLPRKLIEEKSFDFEIRHKVVYSELDENRHMNNTVYADLIYDYAPYNIEKPVKSCRIYYNGEALLWDVLNIKVKATEKGHIVSCVNETRGKSCFEGEISFE
jgi:medium-chain acyl-[acyl-carrier-protein] hydrolase